MPQSGKKNGRKKAIFICFMVTYSGICDLLLYEIIDYNLHFRYKIVGYNLHF